MMPFPPRMERAVRALWNARELRPDDAAITDSLARLYAKLCEKRY